jgi:hypothetical protein
MQAAEECNERVVIQKYSAALDFDDGAFLDHWNDYQSREEAWIEASEQAVKYATAFMAAGYHKQIVNRLLEPFMWIDTLVTATDWANFFALRDHKDAEPHIRDLAVLVKEAMAKSEPRKLKPGEWHMPYITDDDRRNIGEYVYGLQAAHDIEHYSPPPDLEEDSLLRKISASRCARISYAPFDGNGSIDAELERFEKLVGNWPVHASPVEHQATPDDWLKTSNFGAGRWNNPELHRNFHGWIQYRALLPNETVRDE